MHLHLSTTWFEHALQLTVPLKLVFDLMRGKLLRGNVIGETLLGELRNNFLL